jgi:hypothetical protein
MNRARLVPYVVPLAVAAGLALAPRGAVAEEMRWKSVTYVTKMDVKPVGDVEGHVAGPWARRGVCLFANGEVAVYASGGTLDATKGKGTAKGENTCTLRDGSSITMSWTVSFEPGAGGLPVYGDGRGEYVRGTGRFQGIKGTFSFSGAAYTPNKDETKGDVVMDCEGQYTLTRT